VTRGALHSGSSQGLRFFDARVFFANAADPDADEGIRLQHIELARYGTSHPVGVLPEPRNRAKETEDRLKATQDLSRCWMSSKRQGC
jgi:hypothetical protein